jgi:hypothetical protein
MITVRAARFEVIRVGNDRGSCVVHRVVFGRNIWIEYNLRHKKGGLFFVVGACRHAGWRSELMKVLTGAIREPISCTY